MLNVLQKKKWKPYFAITFFSLPIIDQTEAWDISQIQYSKIDWIMIEMSLLKYFSFGEL